MGDRPLLLLTVCFGVLGTLGLPCCKTPEAIIVYRDSEPCLFRPPPVPKRVLYPECPGFTACLDSTNADVLLKNLSDQQQWEAEAWLRCGPFERDAGQ